MKTLSLFLALAMSAANSFAADPPKLNLPQGNTITTGQPGGVMTTSTVYPVVKVGNVGLGPATSSTSVGKPGTAGHSSTTSRGMGITIRR
jgi:hypothetical protein